MRQVRIIIAALLLFSPFVANAIPISDLDDTLWLAGSGAVTFEITFVSGALVSRGDLEFGLYDPTDLSTRVVFGNGYMLGDTAILTDIGGSPFGFFLSNTGTSFNGPYTYFSDSLLNPLFRNAMVAEIIGINTWLFEFEDRYLALVPGDGDLRVRITNVGHTVTEPGTLALLGLGIIGLGFARRRKKV